MKIVLSLLLMGLLFFGVELLMFGMVAVVFWSGYDFSEHHQKEMASAMAIGGLLSGIGFIIMNIIY
jgi:CHASE3 domain sensor protein